MPFAMCELCISSAEFSLPLYAESATISKIGDVHDVLVSVEMTLVLRGTLADALERQNISRTDAIRLLFSIPSDLLQMCRAGACHPDPHAGNVLMHGDKWQYTWADFGMTDATQLDRNALSKLQSLIEQIANSSRDESVTALAERMVFSMKNESRLEDAVLHLTQLLREQLPLVDRTELVVRALPPTLLVLEDLIGATVLHKQQIELLNTIVASQNDKIATQNDTIFSLKGEIVSLKSEIAKIANLFAAQAEKNA